MRALFVLTVVLCSHRVQYVNAKCSVTGTEPRSFASLPGCEPLERILRSRTFASHSFLNQRFFNVSFSLVGSLLVEGDIVCCIATSEKICLAQKLLLDFCRVGDSGAETPDLPERDLIQFFRSVSKQFPICPHVLMRTYASNLQHACPGPRSFGQMSSVLVAPEQKHRKLWRGTVNYFVLNRFFVWFVHMSCSLPTSGCLFIFQFGWCSLIVGFYYFTPYHARFVRGKFTEAQAG